MPTHIKVIVSILVLMVGIIFHYFETTFGQGHVAIVGIGLSIFMVIAMWIFPEAGDRAKK